MGNLTWHTQFLKCFPKFFWIGGWTFCSLFFGRCSLVFARCLLVFACYSLLFRPSYCEQQKIGYWNSTTDIFLANFWDFGKFFWMIVFKVFSTCNTSMALLTISEHIFIYFYVLEESEVAARKSSIRKVFLKIPQIHRKTSTLWFPLQ